MDTTNQPSANVSNAQQVMNNFTLMVIEEFLSKKGMKDTLTSFRKEWNRPDEVRNFKFLMN